jgi:hypothetical protein
MQMSGHQKPNDTPLPIWEAYFTDPITLSGFVPKSDGGAPIFASAAQIGKTKNK